MATAAVPGGEADRGYELTVVLLLGLAFGFAYFDRMQPWEALVFKLFDSDAGAVQHTAHSAFEDPNTPPDAAPRQSIEVRTIAYL